MASPPWLVLTLALLWPSLAEPGLLGAEEPCKGQACAFTEASREDGGLGLLQRAMGARAQQVQEAQRLVPTLPPGQDVCHAGPPMTLTKADQDFLEGRRKPKCDWQTAGIFCLNWDKIFCWWLPLGDNSHGWFVLVLLAILLLIAGRCSPNPESWTKETATGETPRQVHFWCHDLPPHFSIYITMAGATMWLASAEDHPTYNFKESPALPIHMVPWWLLFLPSASGIQKNRNISC